MIARVGGDPDEVEVVIAYGESRYEILAALKRYEVDLVVMGSRGAGGVTRALLGSVATAVIRGSACPVLVVSDEPRT
jgi:nucleotide-binding universal stress UspA family protein